MPKHLSNCSSIIVLHPDDYYNLLSIIYFSFSIPIQMIIPTFILDSSMSLTESNEHRGAKKKYKGTDYLSPSILAAGRQVAARTSKDRDSPEEWILATVIRYNGETKVYPSPLPSFPSFFSFSFYFVSVPSWRYILYTSYFP